MFDNGTSDKDMEDPRVKEARKRGGLSTDTNKDKKK